jgi:hypothetical protein
MRLTKSASNEEKRLAKNAQTDTLVFDQNIDPKNVHFEYGQISLAIDALVNVSGSGSHIGSLELGLGELYELLAIVEKKRQAEFNATQIKQDDLLRKLEVALSKAGRT